MEVNKKLLVEKSKSLGKVLISLSKNLLPQTDSKNQRYLDYLVDMKDYYQKKIEQKIGILIGEIDVGLMGQMHKNFYYDFIISEIKKTEKENISLEEKIKVSKRMEFLKFFYPISYLYSSLRNFTKNAFYLPSKKDIIFSNDYFSRVVKEVFNLREDFLMVHELSHALWHKINPDDNEDSKEYSEWSEGFAEYGARSYFNEFLLSDAKSDFKNRGKYLRELKKVEELIEKKGIEVYLEIPKRWEEFEKELL